MINARCYIKWVFIYTQNLSSHSHFNIAVTKEEGDVEEFSHHDLRYKTSSLKADFTKATSEMRQGF